MNRHQTFFIKKFNTFQFCGKEFYEMEGSAFEPPFETISTIGTHDYRNCENCQKSYQIILKETIERFESFPNCCPYHEKLNKVSWFKKSEFESAPTIVADKVIFTNQHIINHIDNQDWYKETTDYIDYTVESFGQMPEGFGEPFCLGNFFFYLNQLIKNSSEKIDHRHKKIIEYIKRYSIPKRAQDSDLKILIRKYEEWLKIFPFDLTFFSHIKKEFEDKLPLFNGTPEINKYSGRSKVKLHTVSSLIESLIKITNTLLTSINTAGLYEKGILNNEQQIKIELIISSRKLKLKEGYNNDSPYEQQRYRKMLKEWFEDEKKFIDEISPLLSTSKIPIGNTTHKLEFTRLSGIDFERLTFNYVNKLKKWDKIEWHGETGQDCGLDIWSEYQGQTFCYQCANYQKMTLKKAKGDIEKLKANNTIPHNLTMVCGGTVTLKQKKEIEKLAKQIGVLNIEIWRGSEFEVKLSEFKELVGKFFGI